MIEKSEAQIKYELECTEKRIRKRHSYKYFTDLLKKLPETSTKEEVLKLIHKSIDEFWGYKSHTKSIWAEESLYLVLKDSKVKLEESIKDTKMVKNILKKFEMETLLEE